MIHIIIYSIWQSIHLPKKNIDELKKQQDELQTEYNNIKAKSIEDMWREELDESLNI